MELLKNSSLNLLNLENNSGKILENTFYNISNSIVIELPYFPNYIRIISTIFCSLILIVGIIGNILVPFVVWKNKDLRSSTNIFLVNLSLVDLLVLIVCVPTGLVELHSEPEVWILGELMCKIVAFAELCVAHASVLTILGISMERYVAICRPLKANYTCTKERAILLCISIWIIGLIATSPMLLIAKHKELQYIDFSIKAACLMEAHNFWSTLYFLSSIIIFFFIPLIILILIYWVISKNLICDPCNTSLTSRIVTGMDHPTMRARKQVVLMLVTVVLFFFICLLPFRILYIYIIIGPVNSLSDMGSELYYNILYLCRIMLYLNSAINPILYNLMSSKFREAFYRVLGCSSTSNQWICRHSTFTTTTSIKSNGLNSIKLIHTTSTINTSTSLINKKNPDTKIPDGKSLPNSSNSIYFPSTSHPKRQLSSDATLEHSKPNQSNPINKLPKKQVLRAHSIL